MPRKKKTNLHGLNGKNFPRSVRWAVDVDYLHKLSSEEAEWLAKFHDCFHGADFRNTDQEDWDTESRRERYRAKNAANRDTYTTGLVDETPTISDLELPDLDRDLESTPEYLNGNAYKKAKDAFRKAIDAGEGYDIPKRKLARISASGDDRKNRGK